MIAKRGPTQLDRVVQASGQASIRVEALTDGTVHSGFPSYEHCGLVVG